MNSKGIQSQLIEMIEGPLSDNLFAKILTINYNIFKDLESGPDFQAEVLKYYNYLNPSLISLKDIKNIKITKVADSHNIPPDLRLKSFRLSNVRGIPNNINNIPFGIDFTFNNQINSAVILGPNGSGKSSIFSALEMIYCNEIGEMKLRGQRTKSIENKYYEDYLKRFDFKSSIPFCEIETPSGSFNLNNKIFKDKSELEKFNPSNYFISDYDIYSNSQISFSSTDDTTNTFHYLLASSLGLKEQLNLLKLTSSISNMRISLKKESKLLNTYKIQIAEYEDRIKEQEEIIKKNRDLLNSIPKNKEVNNNSPSKLYTLATSLETDFGFLPFTPIDKNAPNKFLLNFSKLSWNEEMELTQFEIDFLNNGLNLLHTGIDCPFCKASNKDISTILNEVEKRLRKLYSNTDLLNEINQNYSEAISTIATTLNYLTGSYDAISSERIKLQSVSKFNRLTVEEEKLYILLSPIAFDEELMIEINSLNKTQNPNFDNYNKLYSLISANLNFFEKCYSLCESIDEFIKFRNQEINLVKSLLLSNQKHPSLEFESNSINLEIAKANKLMQQFEQELYNIRIKMDDANRGLENLSALQQEAKQFTKIFSIKINRLVNELFEPIKETIEEILNSYLLVEEDSTTQIKIYYKSKQSKNNLADENYDKVITASIVKSGFENNAVNTSPEKYFNTARYRLFCLSVSISIAVATRVKYRLNFPLILDDIFLSSDYAMKTTFSEFIKKIIYIFQKYTPEMPFQFIVLTHDDMIFRSAIDAINNYIQDDLDEELKEETRVINKIHPRLTTIFGRLFSPLERDSISSIAHNKFKYWDLLYKFPKQ